MCRVANFLDHQYSLGEQLLNLLSIVLLIYTNIKMAKVFECVYVLLLLGVLTAGQEILSNSNGSTHFDETAGSTAGRSQ